jgi:hypothetical protein
MVLRRFTGWKPVLLRESRTPPGHRLKTCAANNFLGASPSFESDGLFFVDEP